MSATTIFTDGLFGLSDELSTSLSEVLAAIEALGATASITVMSAIDGDDITVYRNDTWSFSAEVTFALTAYEAVAFVVKRSAGTADESAILYVRSDTGLQAIGGAAPVSPITTANGSLTIDSATEFSVLVDMAATNVTPRKDGYAWWLKVFEKSSPPNEGYTRATGKFIVKDYGVGAVA